MLRRAFHFIALCACATLALVAGATAQQQQAARNIPATSRDTRKTVRVERAPLRAIKDPHSSFSAVAVDTVRDEIVLEDENKAQIMVYGRLDNTPPRAALTEPRRIIGGPNTKVQMNCGVYVDPTTGDIYSVNGDTADWLTVWSREAKGNVPPTRELEAPHRAFGVAVDEEAKELFVSVQHPAAIVVWPKMAKGKDVPLRVLEGDKTLLAEAQGIALDTKNQLLYVANQGGFTRTRNNVGWARAMKPGAATWDIPDRILDDIPGSGVFFPPSINVYPLKANGEVPPLRVIQGPLTQLNWPAHISVDAEHGEVFVANPVTDEILVFRATANGNVAPIRILKGQRTNIKNPHGVFVDTKNDELVVANFGNHSSTIYRRTASGDTAPIRMIRSAPPNTPAPMFGNIGSVAYDTKRNELLVFN